ncbi:MAG: hypothetical protein U9R60_17050 [Bacteroidota bacterium]|nr:hypothetical protein [Bacteroidota bacterium]
MRRSISEIRHLYYLAAILLVFNPEPIQGQENEHYSEFRTEVSTLLIDYRLEEALTLCKNSDESKREVIAAKSVVYSLMGNKDKDESVIKKGFDLVKPYLSLKDDYDIHVALAVSYGMQANHSGLKDKIEFADLSVHHCKDALELNPNLPHPNFILGRFYFELSEMSKMTAEMAKAVIDKEEIDRASYDLALSYLVKASEIAPTRFLYNYYTGLAYQKSGNEERANHYYRLADKNTRHSEDDEKADKDLQKELK